MKIKKYLVSLISLLLVITIIVSAFIINVSTANATQELLDSPDYTKSSLNLDADIVGLTRDEFSTENNAGDGYIKKAETEYLELYLGESDFLVPNTNATAYVSEGTQKRYDIAIYDKRSKKLWHSLVDDSEFVNTNYAEVLTAQFQSLVTFSYIDAKKDENVTIDASVMDSNTTEITTEDILNGVRINFSIVDLGISFSVDFKLGEDFLDVSVPADKIEEHINDIDKYDDAKIDLADKVAQLQNSFSSINNDFSSSSEVAAKIIVSKIDRIDRVLLDLSSGNLSSQNGTTKYDTLKEYVDSLFTSLKGYTAYSDQMAQISGLVDALDDDIQYLTVSHFCGIVKLNVLPYFGAGNGETNGYVFYPDGSGAISYFNKYHSVAAKNFCEDIYTNTVLDLATYQGYTTDDDTNEHEDYTSVRMPVFGVKNGEDAFVSIIAEGDSNASITYNPSFSSINVSNVFCSYYLRATTQNTLSDGTIQDIIDSDLISQSRTQRYYFLSQESADYSGMAVAYRDYLEEHNLINKSSVYDSDVMPLDLTTFMGLYSQDNAGSSKYTTLTTYSEAQNILETLKSKGISNINVTLEGWSSAGYFDKQPDYDHSPQSTLGGKSGLEALTDYANANNISISLQVSNIFGYQRNISYSDSNNATIKNYGEFTISYNDTFLFNPFAVYNRAISTSSKLKSYGIKSLTYTLEGLLIYVDYNSKARISREETKDLYTELAKQTKDTVGSVSFENSNIYVAQYADWIKQVPESGKGYLFTDEQVPFYQIVLHGLIPYSGSAYNTMYDTKYQSLKAIEFGYIPSYILTEEITNIKSSYIDFLFSSQASDWYDEIADTYSNYVSGVGELWKEKMMKVEKIDDTLNCVTYESGAKIYLNYADSDRLYNGILVKAMDYKVVK